MPNKKGTGVSSFVLRLGLLAFNLIGASVSISQGAERTTRGHLVIIGGGEVPAEITERFIKLAGGAKAARIVVIPMASDEPLKSGQTQVESFQKMGVQDAMALMILREHADDEEILEALDKATGIYFTGGDQSRLATNMVGTAAEKRLHSFYERGGVVAGTSAGAAIMSEVMITGTQRLHKNSNDGFTTIEKNNTVTARGLGLVKYAIIDQHFIARKRQNRLFGLVLEHPKLLGIGIDEGTAIVVQPGGMLEVIGNGSVMIFDPRQGSAINAAENNRLSGRNIRTHLLIAGDRFDPRVR